MDGRYQEALEQFQEYLRRRPDSTAALLGLANCQLSLAQRPAARATLQELFARQKDNPAGCLVQARLELEEDAPAEALTWLKRAEALAPYETDITQTEIGTLRQLGRHEEADRYEQKLKDLYQRFERLEDLKKQLLRDPENTTLRYQAGTVCLGLHREDEAARWFQSVLRLDPRHAPTHRALADYFQKHGEPQRAEYHRRRAEGGGESRATTP